MVDGYEGYQGVCEAEQLTRLGCWAHARRKFVDAQRQQPQDKTGKADQALAFIQKLYAIEKRSKELPPEERHKVRQQQAKPIIDKLHQWLQKSLVTTPPKSTLGKALAYLHNQWPRLIDYHRSVTTPSTIIERSMRYGPLSLDVIMITSALCKDRSFYLQFILISQP